MVGHYKQDIWAKLAKEFMSELYLIGEEYGDNGYVEMKEKVLGRVDSTTTFDDAKKIFREEYDKEYTEF